MERFISLKINNEQTLTVSKQIEKYLYGSQFHWVLSCECENVVIEIKNDILYFKGGIIFWGETEWMVFERGEFRSGIWKGGIWLGGLFNKYVTWKNGVFKDGVFKGIKVKGEFPEEEIK